MREVNSKTGPQLSKSNIDRMGEKMHWVLARVAESYSIVEAEWVRSRLLDDHGVLQGCW